jgi:pyrroloquinoline quinone biosynthesis protein B
VRLRVLGSAAGGGSPQWNCGCPNCSGLRRGDPGIRARSQASAVVSADEKQWFLLNASPDVRTQLESFAALHPRTLRDTPLGGVALTNGDVDACLGLFVLREDQPLSIFATKTVVQGLREHNVLTRTLERHSDHFTWTLLAADEPRPLVGAGGPSGLSIEAIPVPGKVPLHLEGQMAPTAEDNVALRFRDPRGTTLLFAPSVGGWSEALEQAARTADLLLFDGTFFSDDELIRLGLGQRRARDMAHWPLGGAEGSLRWLAQLPCRRKLLIHINNTNPILREDAAERAELAAAGVEVGHDGLEVTL